VVPPQDATADLERALESAYGLDEAIVAAVPKGDRSSLLLALGRAIDHEINNRVVGLDLDQIRRIPRVIGVAGGGEKHAAVRAALRGGLVSVIVTDEHTATWLLEERSAQLP